MMATMRGLLVATVATVATVTTVATELARRAWMAQMTQITQMTQMTRIAMILSVFTILAAPACAIDFSVPESTVTEVATNPEYYDGTITIGTIGIAGTLVNISKDTRIVEGSHAINVDAKDRSLFLGFEDGDTVKMIGVFYHNRIDGDIFVPECVLHWPPTDSGTVAVAELTGNPSAYNGRKVVIFGNLTDVRESGMGYRMDIEEDGAHADVRFYGRTVLEAGTEVKVIGIFVGDTLYAETVAKRKTLPFGIKVPGFSGFSGLLAVGICALAFLMKRGRLRSSRP